LWQEPSWGKMERGALLANLIITMPDHLVRSLEGIAAAQHKTVEQLAIEQLRSLVRVADEAQLGSAAALLGAMQNPPHPSALDVAELEAAIAAARIPMQKRDLFSD
jgi:hypothetical protein